MEQDSGHISTVIVETYRNQNQQPLSGLNSYKGLKIHALPGLHEFVAGIARNHIKTCGTVLDLAAGSGAMSKRMSDMGYQVTATDYVTENFKLHTSIPFVTANLNDFFSQHYLSNFDAIVASEIIEHLENPRHFARECFKLLSAGGKLILSTPNIDSPASIACFMRSGTFLWFADAPVSSRWTYFSSEPMAIAKVFFGSRICFSLERIIWRRSRKNRRIAPVEAFKQRSQAIDESKQRSGRGNFCRRAGETSNWGGRFCLKLYLVQMTPTP